MRMIKKLAVAGVVLFLLLSAIGCAGMGEDKTPYGPLQIIGSKLSDKAGNPVQLKGISTMGLQYYGPLVNADTYDALKYDWEADVIRLALYVGQKGYADHPELINTIRRGIQLAINRNMYVIVDWHVLDPGDPNDAVYSGAEEFFATISKEFGKYENVIYEIMSTPGEGTSWASDLKPYAQKIIDVIRSNDPDNIIIVGSPNKGIDVDVAAADPVDGQNIMYSFQFWAGSHGQAVRNKINTAVDQGAAVICTQWGVGQDAFSEGNYVNSADFWIKYLNLKGISWVNWGLSDGKGSAPALNIREPAAVSELGYKYWPMADLSISGAWVRAQIKGIDSPTFKIPVAAWDYDDGTAQDWMVASDSAVKVKMEIADAETPAMHFTNGWANVLGEEEDAWDTAPRLTIQNAGSEIGKASVLSFDVYLEAGKTMAGPFEIMPVFQYAPDWWTELGEQTLDYENGIPAGDNLLKFSIDVPYTVASETSLGHIVLVVLGQGSGYDGSVYFDSIAINYIGNGDDTGGEVVK